MTKKMTKKQKEGWKAHRKSYPYPVPVCKRCGKPKKPVPEAPGEYDCARCSHYYPAPDLRDVSTGG